MHSFRAFAQGKATWILNYSWDGDKVVDKHEAMMNLAMSQIMAGANFWDAPGHSMAGSNDLTTRKKIFDWIGEHEKTFYLPRTPIDPIGVYFSVETRNLYAEEFLASYRGILILLMQKHLEFQIVTPRTLAEFRGKTLVLPDVRVLDDSEQKWLKDFVSAGKKVVITGTDVTELGESPKVVRMRDCPGKAYNAAIEKDFEHSSPDSQREFFSRLEGGNSVGIEASPLIATSISRTADGHINCFFANFAGLRGGSNPVQTPQTGVVVRVALSKAHEGKGFFLSFLGNVQEVKAEAGGNSILFRLPAITKGAVFWYEP
jgi:hypothetical protein